MKNNFNSFLTFVSILLIAVLLSAYVSFIGGSNKPEPVYEISVVLNGPHSNYWDLVKQGIDKAAYDMNVDISFVSLLNQNDAQEQLAAIQRELDDGAQAVIVAPVEVDIFERMKENQKDRQRNVPVISMGFRCETGGVVASVYPDNKEMGESIARLILEETSRSEKIVLLTTEQVSAGVRERIEGISSVLEPGRLNYWTTPMKGQEAINLIKSNLVLEDMDVLIAPDFINLLNVSEARSSLDINTGLKVYGIDATPEIVSYLEKGVIESITAYKSFDIGYLSVRSAIAALKRDSHEAFVPVSFKAIQRENIYSAENQRLLFPFVK